MLLYKSVLLKDTMDYLLRLTQSYCNIVEIQSIPVDFDKWLLKNNTPGTSVSREDCMANKYDGQVQRWASLWKDPWDKDAGVFLFLPTKKIKEQFCSSFEHLIINPEPFQTIIG